MTEAKRAERSPHGPSGAESIRRPPGTHAQATWTVRGVRDVTKCGWDLIADATVGRNGVRMAANPILMPTSPDRDGSSAAPTGVVMSSDEYAVLVRELETVRATHRRELAQRLHDVRVHGTTSDDDDLLAVLEDTAIGRARIAQLEDLVRCATVLDDDDARFDGGAGLGSTVRVADDAGRTVECRLIGRRTADSRPDEVSLGTPVGMALVGVGPGDVVRVSLSSGRDRSLTVLGVSAPPLSSERSRCEFS
jgi:transcription elongation factor GreA